MVTFVKVVQIANWIIGVKILFAGTSLSPQTLNSSVVWYLLGLKKVYSYWFQTHRTPSWPLAQLRRGTEDWSRGNSRTSVRTRQRRKWGKHGVLCDSCQHVRFIINFRLRKCNAGTACMLFFLSLRETSFYSAKLYSVINLFIPPSLWSDNIFYIV